MLATLLLVSGFLTYVMALATLGTPLVEFLEKRQGV